MKRTASVLLSLVLTLTALPLLSNAQSETLIASDFSNGLNDWTISATADGTGVKTDETTPYVHLVTDNKVTSAQLISPTVHIEADTKYELSFYVRVSQNAYFDPNKASCPNFGIFEPSQKGVNGTTQTVYAEGQNNYAYSYAADFTVTRRMGFKSEWKVDGYDPVKVNGYSNFGAKLHNTDGQGIGVSPKVAYANWTKVTAIFDTIADDKNPAQADIAIGFVLKFEGAEMDIKNISLKVWQEPPPSGPYSLADENGIIGGYVTKSGLNYTAIPYAGNEFDGWYDHNNQFISDSATITATSYDDYYGATFKNTNLIKDSGFEGYEAGSIIFDSATDKAQDWRVYSMQSATVINGAQYNWVNTKTSATVARSGSKSMYGTTYYQTATTAVVLAPNTKYHLSFWYLYKTYDPNCYVSNLSYGIYYPNSATNKLQAATGENTTATVGHSADFAPDVWKKATLTFTTDDNVDNLVFGYCYNDTNSAGLSSINKTTLYVDDVVIMPYEKLTKANITIDTKTSSSVTLSIGDANNVAVGDQVDFTVLTQKGLTPTVTVNGEVITPKNGTYSFVADIDGAIKVTCPGDENRRSSSTDKDGNDLTAYNPDIYLKPIWSGNTVYHEAALFIPNREAIKLLYPISEAISVRSYDLKTNYLEGVDYEITSDGLIKRLEGSRIPVYTAPLIGGVNSSGTNQGFPADDGQYLQFIDDRVYPQFAINVTYEHTTTWKGDEGYNPYPIASMERQLPKVFEKLKNGEGVDIIIFGDSASCGWSSSGLNSVNEIYDDTNTEGNFKNYAINVAPYTPTWIEMLTASLKSIYPDANIRIKNLALGGKDSNWGRLYFKDRLKLLSDDFTPDLMILCFAGNDATGRMDNATYKNNFQSMINTLRDPSVKGGNPNADVLLWSQNLPNTNAVTYRPEVFLGYEKQLEEIAAENQNVGLVKLTSAYVQIIKSKQAIDYLNTNVNHGNDFLTRTIAQALITALTPAAHLAGDVNADGAVDLNDVVSLAQIVAGWENVQHDPIATDVNSDGQVDLNDVVRLAQHVAGWNVDIF